MTQNYHMPDPRELISLAEGGWKPIATAPRDGTLILLKHEDVGSFLMGWGHIQKNGLFPGRVGMWVAPDGSMTWQDGEEEGPSHWRPLDTPLRALAAQGETHA